MPKPRHIVVIDPATHRAELPAYNRLSLDSPVPLTYHLPALFGPSSLEHDTENVIGMIVLGSRSSVNDRTDWQKALEAWLMPRLQQKIPTLGICYGHQMLAHMFGSKVGYLFPDQKKLTGFQISELAPNVLWDNQKLSGSLFVSHCEVVKECPKDMVVIAKRDSVPIDGLMHKTLPIWSFQPHPEATPSFAEARGAAPHPDPKQFEFGHSLVKKFLEFAAKNRS